MASITDETWEEIRKFIPERQNTHPRGGGRKPKDDRLVFESILFVLRYQCQWNALNDTGLCPSSTVHDRYQKWLKAGVFHRLRDAGILARDTGLKSIDWSWLDDESTTASGAILLSAQGREKARPTRPAPGPN